MDRIAEPLYLNRLIQVNSYKEFNIKIGCPDEQNELKMTMNETLLYMDVKDIVGAFKKCI